MSAIKKTICLNMIVKNEVDVIARCLASVLPWIDYWVIVDTGSSDGTQEEIKRILKDLPGELYEKPWIDFEHNRNEALVLARGKGDYLLFIDADDQLIFSNPFELPFLDLDYYLITQRDVTYKMDLLVVFLVQNCPRWKWVGVAHETLVCSGDTRCGFIDGVTNLYLNDGIRSKDPKKKQEVIELLEKGLKREPQNARTAFYLAQSYRGSMQYDQAIEMYQKRVAMEGNGEEVFSSLYWIARLQEETQKDPEVFIRGFAKAHQFAPSRFEPLYSIIAYYIQSKQYFLGYLLAHYSLPLKEVCKTATFVQKWMYEWGLFFELFACCVGLGKKEEAKKIREKLLLIQDLPDSLREQVTRVCL